MILKVPNSIYVTIDIGKHGSISINNSSYMFYRPEITTIGEDIYIVGVTREDYNNGIYEPSVYKCNKSIIESGENISFVCKIPTGNLLESTSVNLNIKFVYINNTFLYLVDNHIYLSTDLNNWKEIKLYDQISPPDLPSEDQNIYLNKFYFFTDNNKLFSYGRNDLYTYEIINEDQLLVNNDKVDIDHVNVDIIDTLDQINESSSTPQVLSASGVKTELDNIKNNNFDIDNISITKNSEQVLQAANINVDSKYAKAELVNVAYHSSVVTSGDEYDYVTPFFSVSGENSCIILFSTEFGDTTNNFIYKDLYQVGFIGSDYEKQLTKFFSNGISFFNFKTPEEIIATFGENYKIYVADVQYIKTYKQEDTYGFLFCVTDSNWDGTNTTSKTMLYYAELNVDYYDKKETWSDLSLVCSSVNNVENFALHIALFYKDNIPNVFVLGKDSDTIAVSSGLIFSYQNDTWVNTSTVTMDQEYSCTIDSYNNHSYYTCNYYVLDYGVIFIGIKDGSISNIMYTGTESSLQQYKEFFLSNSTSSRDRLNGHLGIYKNDTTSIKYSGSLSLNGNEGLITTTINEDLSVTESIDSTISNLSYILNDNTYVYSIESEGNRYNYIKSIHFNDADITNFIRYTEFYNLWRNGDGAYWHNTIATMCIVYDSLIILFSNSGLYISKDQYKQAIFRNRYLSEKPITDSFLIDDNLHFNYNPVIVDNNSICKSDYGLLYTRWVPEGYIYTQYPGELDPLALFGSGTWEDISSNFENTNVRIWKKKSNF